LQPKPTHTKTTAENIAPAHYCFFTIWWSYYAPLTAAKVGVSNSATNWIVPQISTKKLYIWKDV